MDLVPYAIPFFLLAIAIELARDAYAKTGYYRTNDAINSLSLGVLSTTSKLVLIDIAGRVYAWVQQDLVIAEWRLEGWLSLVVAFVAYDFCYYWFHRISHERRIFWAAHVAHHQSEEYNLTTALRQTSTGFLLGWLFYLPLFLLGMPADVFVTVASANLIYQFWVHTRFIKTLGPLEYVLVTPMNHRVHHARNPDYIDRNYGGFFILWDRLFGTYKAEDPRLPIDYGITRGLNSWNPLWANVHVYSDMLSDTLRTPRLRDKLQGLVRQDGVRAARSGEKPGAARQPLRSATGHFVESLYWRAVFRADRTGPRHDLPGGPAERVGALADVRLPAGLAGSARLADGCRQPALGMAAPGAQPAADRHSAGAALGAGGAVRTGGLVRPYLCSGQPQACLVRVR